MYLYIWLGAALEIGSFNGKINDLVVVLEQHAVRIDEQKLRVRRERENMCMLIYICMSVCLCVAVSVCVAVYDVTLFIDKYIFC